MKKYIFTLLIVSSALFLSCDNKVYDKYNHTPIAGWEKNDTLSFNVPKQQSNGLYGIDLGLRIDNAYPFMGLTLIVEQRIFPSKELKIDTLNCDLIDKNGNPRNQGISYYQYNFHVNDLSLAQGDSLHITVRHDMKREILPGISDVGIQIEKEK
jgi:gliding motility-associated lipoprotein GldH